MKAVIIEDEEIIANLLLSKINKLAPDIQVVAILPSLKMARRWFGENAAPITGIIGGIIALVIVYALSVRSVHGRANRGRGLAPTRPPEGEGATKTPTPQ